MSSFVSTVPTPVGPFTVVADRDGAVLASGWTTDVGWLTGRIAAPMRPSAAPTPRTDLGQATKAVTAYFDGDLAPVDAVPVRQHAGGGFLTHAWEVLRGVPAGAPVTYTEFAARCGRPAAVRAAGQACSRNTAGLFVPCHRVVPRGGGVGSFLWGPPVKQWLIAYEARVAGKGEDGK